MNESVIIPDKRIKEFPCTKCTVYLRYIEGRTDHVVCPVCRKIYYIEEMTVISN